MNKYLALMEHYCPTDYFKENMKESLEYAFMDYSDEIDYEEIIDEIILDEKEEIIDAMHTHLKSRAYEILCDVIEEMY